MADKKIIIKNPRFWFHSADEYGKTPAKRPNHEYHFREQSARQGAIIEPYVNEKTRAITFTSINSGLKNQNAYPFSLTRTPDLNAWEKRKIIDSIEIKISKNVQAEEHGSIFFTILQVNKDLLKVTTPYVANHITSDQIIPRNSKDAYFSLPMFSSSVKIDNLKYDLSRDDDLILLQHIEFKEFIKTRKNVKYGVAHLPYVTYETRVIYSDNFF